MAKAKESSKVRGFFRLQITEDVAGNPVIVGDSGWRENVVVNDGFNDYLCKALGGVSGSRQVSHVALGTGGAPATNDTSLSGEVSKRAAVTAATSSNSKTIRFTATFNSSDSFVTTTQNLSNIGLFDSSSSGSLFAGNTYSSSSCATNQNVNVTYDITFA